MTAPVHYDQSCEVLVKSVVEVLGQTATSAGTVLRDAAGRLTFVSATALPDETRIRLSDILTSRLGRYARPDRVVAAPGDPGVERLQQEKPSQWLSLHGCSIKLVDRRIVGADWLTAPALTLATPPRFVFASLKGGVGRTTALCVVATDLARDGENVLVIDLDLEAPGAGSLLRADPIDTPRFGAIDYLAESVLSDDLDAVLESMIVSVAAPAGGQIDVVPAYGSASVPEHYLGKLSRALLDVGPEGVPLTLRTKVSRLVDALVARRPYDVILIDARAGLAEVSAGPLLGLGATVLLFGTAQRQTIDGLRLLLAHLRALIPDGSRSPWRDLQVVLAKATSNEEQNHWFLEQAHTLFEEYIYEEQEELEGFNFDQKDSAAPHFPVPIAFNPTFADWDPARRPTDLTHSFYESSFARLLAFVRTRLPETP